MLVVTEDNDRGLTIAEATVRDRVTARLRARSLDVALASGTPPESSLRLALRAQHLTRPATRRYLARSLERILTEASRPPGLRPNPLTGRRRQVVLTAAADLDALIARLRGRGPVTARGVAQVAVLLSDGAGPLHTSVTEPDLRAAVRQVLSQLDAPLTTS